MKLDALVKRSVKLAFNLVGDLAEDITLTEKQSKSFDFNTSTVATTKPTSKTIKCLLVAQTRSQGESKVGRALPTTINKTMIVQSTDLSDPDIYDTLTTSDGKVWNMVPPYENDGAVIKITVSREA